MAANESALGRYAWIGLLAIAGLSVVAVRPVVADGGAGMMGGGYGGGTVGMVPGFGGFLWPLLLIGGVLALLYWAGDRGGADHHGGARADAAMETLRQRYARGELTEEEFEERRRRLER
ncbi:MAG: SHOCT domain-containing protein [Halobacteriota archaeon]